jgi:tetratricopeptide (TPR) repeat protein
VGGTPAAAGVVYNLKGGLHLAQGYPTAAEEAFGLAIEKNPNLIEPYYAMAGIHLRAQQADKAVEQFKNLLDVNPKQAGPHMMIGVVYDSQKRFDLSEKHYRSALEIEPKFAPAANNLAYILAEQNRDLDEALRLARTAKEILPEDPNVMDTLGWVLFKKQIYDLAVSELKASLAKNPDNPTVVYHLGMAYLKKGETDRARAELERAFKLNPDFEGAAEARKALEEIK